MKQQSISPEGFFFVITPLNYLFALEAKAKFKNELGACHLVIMGNFQPSLDQFRSMVRLDGWDSIRYRPRAEQGLQLKSRLNVVKDTLNTKKFLNQFQKEIFPNDLLFIANIQNHFTRYLLRKTHARNKVILDDGLSTIDFIRRGTDANYQCHQAKSVIKRLILGKSELNRHSLTFFSLYSNLDWSPSAFIPNEMTHLKHKIVKKTYEKKNIVLFIGQYLPKLDVISREHFINSVEKIRKKEEIEGNQFQYCVHRSDNTELPETWNILQGTKPIEIIVGEMEALPMKIYSFYSSALPNMQVLFKDRIEFIYLRPPLQWIGEKHRKTLQSIYDYLEETQNTHVKVVSLQS